MRLEELKAKIRDIPDFPKPGILFRDITPLLADGRAFRAAIDALGDRYVDQGIDLVVGVEARGFILASALAYKLGAGHVIIRKPGKLPFRTYRESYALEYGNDSLEIHEDAIRPGQRVLLADDLLATGGTMAATLGLVSRMGGNVVGLCFLIELTDLKGRNRLQGHEVFSLMQF